MILLLFLAARTSTWRPQLPTSKERRKSIRQDLTA